MVYIIGQTPRQFGDLKPDDSIYLIDPNTGSIVQTKVRSTVSIYKNGRVEILKMEIYKITAFESITTKAMEEAKEAHNTSINWTIRTPNYLVLGPVQLPNLPITMVSADKKFLQRWMDKTGPNKKKIIY